MKEKYVVFGAGMNGRAAVHYFNLGQIAAVIDNNPLKIGRLFEGIRIISFKEYLEKYRDIKIIVSIHTNNYFDVKKQLEKENIFDYFTAPPVMYGTDLPERMSEELLYLKSKRIVFYDTNPISIRMFEWLRDHCKVECCFIQALKEKGESGYGQQYSFITLDELSDQDTLVISTNEVEEHIRELLKGCFKGTVFDVYERPRLLHSELLKFKDKYKGQRCFVIGNGPSLQIEDLNILEQFKEKTFAANRIHHIFGQTNWRPTYYVSVDLGDYLFKELKEYLDESSFLAEHFYTNEKRIEGVNHFSMINKIYGDEGVYFSDDITKGVASGRTVTYAMLQFACYMGFSKIYLLGVDFTFGEEGTNTHFCSDYNLDEKDNELVRTQVVLDKEEIRQAYISARTYAKKHNIEIYNATRGGKLDVFERVNFDELFSYSALGK